MTIAFVLGNGISRKGISLPYLKQRGKIYGCNALYREFIPDVLVATDKPIATKIQESGYSLENVFYTRHPIDNLGARRLSSDYRGYSSGPNAAALAAEDRASKIFLLGFDMGPTESNLFNNVYADTEFYKSATNSPTYTGNWVKQICQVVSKFPHTQFYRVCGPTTAIIPELERLKNLEHQPLDSFVDRINNQKDL
jgi:hypothetical protein